MKKYLIPCGAVLLFTSCGLFSGKEKNIESDSVKIAASELIDSTQGNSADDGETIDMDTSTIKRLSWIDDVMKGYLRTPEGVKIVQGYKYEKDVNWIWDSMRKTDSATYVVLQLGGDVDNGEGMVFSTAAWIYVDTLSRKAYEYSIEKEDLRPLNIPAK
ncbi:hypothetical protein [Chitinophaga sp. Cy-1792]|uniref:hypothetical protein n=1 Tax=Chitinophaga sp. Cy-1792 TaxID=2608339 RepID=UPI00141E0B89|nr:hypothetical protein [Chitinophaga sp. Cy-1792]NIG56228.1 hypothetical protein [Chitinophaga sp. Cy-1792]